MPLRDRRESFAHIDVCLRLRLEVDLVLSVLLIVVVEQGPMSLPVRQDADTWLDLVHDLTFGHFVTCRAALTEGQFSSILAFQHEDTFRISPEILREGDRLGC